MGYIPSRHSLIPCRRSATRATHSNKSILVAAQRASTLRWMSHLSIQDLYPNLPPEKQQEVEEFFDRYLDFVLRTYERIKSDPQLYEEFLSLTGYTPSRTMDSKGRSFTSEYGDTDV